MRKEGSEVKMDRKIAIGRKEEGEERGRCRSWGSMEEYIKRKRGEGEGGTERELEALFKRSRKTIRSPMRKEKGEGEGEKGGDLGGLLREWKGEMEEVLKEIKEGKGWKEEVRQWKEEMSEELRVQRDWWKGEVGGIRKELRERESRWEEEREEMRGYIRGLEDRVAQLEGRKRAEGVGKEEGRETVNRVRDLERRMEMKEREERKKNILIRGVKIKEEKRKEAVEEIMEVIGVRVTIEVVRKLRGGEKEGELIWVRLGSEEQRKEVLRGRKKLRGRRERIMEDWTWKERRMRWKLEEIARIEEREGKRTWIGYGRIRIEEQWWRWDEEEEVLKDGGGNNWKAGEGRVGGK